MKQKEIIDEDITIKIKARRYGYYREELGLYKGLFWGIIVSCIMFIITLSWVYNLA